MFCISRLGNNVGPEEEDCVCLRNVGRTIIINNDFYLVQLGHFPYIYEHIQTGQS